MALPSIVTTGISNSRHLEYIRNNNKVFFKVRVRHASKAPGVTSGWGVAVWTRNRDTEGRDAGYCNKVVVPGTKCCAEHQSISQQLGGSTYNRCATNRMQRRGIAFLDEVAKQELAFEAKRLDHR
jgi:hypothetical protein